MKCFQNFFLLGLDNEEEITRKVQALSIVVYLNHGLVKKVALMVHRCIMLDIPESLHISIRFDLYDAGKKRSIKYHVE